MPSYILFRARRDPAAFMSHAENQVRSSGLRMEPAVFRIKTIYRNYQRARFIEFDRTAFSSSPVPPFFRRWQRALRLSKSASEKLPIRTCMASDTHTVQPRRFPILSFFCFFFIFIFFLGRANELTASALIIAPRRRMIDRAAARAASAGNYGNIIQFI